MSVKKLAIAAAVIASSIAAGASGSVLAVGVFNI